MGYSTRIRFLATIHAMENSRMRLSSSLALLATAILATAVYAEDPPKIKALMIAGGCCHDYPNQARILTEGISARANVEWKIVRYSDTGRRQKIDVYANEDWGKGYDIVVHNECYGGVDDVKFVERIAAEHEKGLPGVVVHCSIHSYRAALTDAWRKCLGVTSRRHEKSRPVTVKPVVKDHPILTDFPDEWLTPQGELYVIEKVWPTATPLATAFGEDTQKDHPIIWTNLHGKGRISGTTLGHHNETMSHDLYLDTITRGFLWACGKLQEDGQPAEGYAVKKKKS